MSLSALQSLVREKDPSMYDAISEIRNDDRHMTSRVLSWKRGKPVLEQDV